MLKLIARGLAVALLSFAGVASAAAQLYGVDPFSGTDNLFVLDPDTGAIVRSRDITVPGRTITGANSITRDPTSGVIYAVVKANAVAGRLLITINPASGQGVEIGNLGDNFASIAFRNDGQLFGVTGDGATVPDTLYLIDKTDASLVVAQTLGNGDDGEVIAYHPPSNTFFHWSGNGTSVLERISGNAPFTVSPVTNGTWDEVFGAVWDASRNTFLVTDINSTMAFWSTSGVISNVQPATTADVRGLALVPFSGVPTASEWALALLALLMAGLAIAALRRRQGPR
jgi:hypothetical protein